MKIFLERTDPPRLLAENLWIVDGDWRGSSFRRRMTVVRLRDGSLWIHSPIALDGQVRLWLDSLGAVQWVVAPNAFHGSEMAWYRSQYPKSFAVASDGALMALSKSSNRNLLSVSQIAPRAWAGEIEAIEVKGTRLLHETAFFHVASQSLILTDLAFHLQDHQFKSKLECWLMARNGIGGGRLGPSKLTETFLFRTRSQLSKSLRRINDWNFDRVIVNHGEIVESNGKARFNQAFARWLN